MHFSYTSTTPYSIIFSAFLHPALLSEFIPDTLCRLCTGKASDRSAFQFVGKPLLDIDESIDHFIRRDKAANAGEGQIRGNKGICDSHRVALDARDLDWSRNRVTYQAQEVLHAKRHRMHDRFGIIRKNTGQSGSGYGARYADLPLASSYRPGEGNGF